MIRLSERVLLEKGLFLAPMAGYTDRFFRLLAFENGAEFATTEMVSAEALVRNDPKTLKLCEISPKEGPVAVQLFGSDPAVLSEAAGVLIRRKKEDGGVLPAAIDINMGCPVRKIFSNGEGCALMKDPGKILRIVRETADVLREDVIPVTVKIRTGTDHEHRNAPEAALAAAEGGASLICVHARTREDLYAPGIDLETLRLVREALPARVPVIGNGDIQS
ncbi:MAG: tRNA-dihydrouridine synthase family protein, partial [Clostridia bacterium]|nr:tRNA-dihydrouridine synthase family protein [Clostridia bacterium]